MRVACRGYAHRRHTEGRASHELEKSPPGVFVNHPLPSLLFEWLAVLLADHRLMLLLIAGCPGCRPSVRGCKSTETVFVG
jgi:hypothetical protein